jgi:hypothetical protein
MDFYRNLSASFINFARQKCHHGSLRENTADRDASFFISCSFEKFWGWYKGNDTVRNMDMISSLSSGVTNVTKMYSDSVSLF